MAKTSHIILALMVAMNIALAASEYCPPEKSSPAKGYKNPPAKSSPAKGYKNPEKCPRDTLKLGACANVLTDLVSVVVGSPPKMPCCSLIGGGIADLEAAVCLCTALKAKVLGVLEANLNVSLTLLLNYCGYGVPPGYQCA